MFCPDDPGNYQDKGSKRLVAFSGKLGRPISPHVTPQASFGLLLSSSYFLSSQDDTLVLGFGIQVLYLKAATVETVLTGL